MEQGPLELATEILARMKAECGLSETKEKTNHRIPFSEAGTRPGGNASNADGKGWKRDGGAGGFRRNSAGRGEWCGRGGGCRRRNVRSHW